MDSDNMTPLVSVDSDQQLQIAMAPSVSLNFISLLTSCVRLQEEEEPQTAFPMSFTWASNMAAGMFMRF